MSRIYGRHIRNIKMNKQHNYWTIEESIKLQSLCQDKEMDFKKIGVVLNRSWSSCCKKAYHEQIPYSFKFKNRHNVNESFWETPNLINSYWAGFLAADGHIALRKGNHYSIRLEIERGDKHHLEKMKADVEYTGPILDYERKERNSKTSLLCINRDKWAYDLEKNFNIASCKTKRLAPPLHIFENRDDLALAYLIGYTDGDGTVTQTKQTIYLSWCSASEKILLWIKDFSDYLFPVLRNQNRPRNVKKYNNHYRFSIGGKDVCKVKEMMLHLNLPYLRRKWDKIILPNENPSLIPA